MERKRERTGQEGAPPKPEAVAAEPEGRPILIRGRLRPDQRLPRERLVVDVPGFHNFGVDPGAIIDLDAIPPEAFDAAEQAMDRIEDYDTSRDQFAEAAVTAAVRLLAGEPQADGGTWNRPRIALTNERPMVVPVEKIEKWRDQEKASAARQGAATRLTEEGSRYMDGAFFATGVILGFQRSEQVVDDAQPARSEATVEALAVIAMDRIWSGPENLRDQIRGILDNAAPAPVVDDAMVERVFDLICSGHSLVRLLSDPHGGEDEDYEDLKTTIRAALAPEQEGPKE